MNRNKSQFCLSFHKKSANVLCIECSSNDPLSNNIDGPVMHYVAR